MIRRIVALAVIPVLAVPLVSSGTATAAESLLSLNKPTTTSSVEDATLAGGLAVDGDGTTRWASAEGSDPQWISVDLGGSAVVTRVKVAWETAYAKDYRVQTSTDGKSWSTRKTVTNGDGGTDEHAFSATGRYVRIYGTKRATVYGYSVWELEVFGSRTGGGDVTPPSTPAGLAAGTTTSDTVSLSWQAATDDVGVTGYEVLRNGNVVGSSTTTSFTDTGLASGTTFSYQVRARDAAGNLSGLSAAVQGTTKPNGDNGIVLVVAGDIAKAEFPAEHNETAELVAGIKPQYVLTVGDNQYDNGTIEEFRNNYDKTWGKFKNITRPTPGNHEHYDKLNGYKQYFGNIAFPQGKPYYSWEVGDWHFVALDSDPLTDGVTGEQLTWLKQDLAANQKRCVGGYWHHARFNSGQYGDEKLIAPFWDELLKVRADVVFSGHDHHYERLKPLNSSGKVDEANGLRSAVVGIGGDNLYKNIKPREGMEKGVAKHGVMKLTLSGTSYSWEVIGIDGTVIDKAGPYTCR